MTYAVATCLNTNQVRNIYVQNGTCFSHKHPILNRANPPLPLCPELNRGPLTDFIVIGQLYVLEQGREALGGGAIAFVGSRSLAVWRSFLRILHTDHQLALVFT